jgi:hypothetical protein
MANVPGSGSLARGSTYTRAVASGVETVGGAVAGVVGSAVNAVGESLTANLVALAGDKLEGKARLSYVGQSIHREWLAVCPAVC